MRDIDVAFREAGIAFDSAHFFEFAREAIRAREFSKFIFSRSVSDVLDLVESLGSQHGISVKEMSFMTIETILKNLCDSIPLVSDTSSILRNSIDRNKAQYRISETLKLPSLIFDPDDVMCFRSFQSEPTFVSTKVITARVVSDLRCLTSEDLDSKIVVVCNADPGWEWLFARNIAGLITCFGGANSHMAIRTNELSIPAVIGCGPENYELYAKANTLSIDCGKKRVLFV